METVTETVTETETETVLKMVTETVTETGPVTAKGEAGASREGSGVQILKCVHRWRMCWSNVNYTRRRVPNWFVTYNIQNGRNRGLKSDLRGVSQANMDLGIFQENKFTDGI